MPAILSEILIERKKQHDKWGEQNHPWRAAWTHSRSAERIAEHYEIPTEARAKFLCQNAGRNGEDDWCFILIEEVAEFVGALSVQDARKELVQIAAVAVAAIESIDRNGR